MPTKTAHSGYVELASPPRDMAEHGLRHAQNHDFFKALIDVVRLLRMEALLRECHPIHDKLIELSDFILAEHCQDFVPTSYPEQMIGNGADDRN